MAQQVGTEVHRSGGPQSLGPASGKILECTGQFREGHFGELL